MDNPESKDPVWKLLSHASNTEPGPFFSRDVVREVRLLEGKGKGRFFEWLSRFRAPILASGLAAVALVAFAILFPAPDTPSNSGSGIALEESADFDPASELEAVEYLGELMAVTDPALLSDKALGDLFF